MKIGVLGTGMVGRALAGRLAELGHEVLVGTRDVEATMARSETDARGNIAFASWLAESVGVRVDTLESAARHGEIVVNATGGEVAVAALTAAGAANLAGKVLIDVTNPLDFSRGMPPRLFVKDDDSLAEQIQREFPDARVVKTLNTTNADVMVHPESLGSGDHTVFVSGDDAEAKSTVTGLLAAFGWLDIVDLGDLTTARGAEMLVAHWIRLMAALGTVTFNYKVVRSPEVAR